MAHPRYTAYYMVLHVSMRSISKWMQRSTFTHTLWRTIVAFEHAKYHVMYADGVCGVRVWAVAVPTNPTAHGPQGPGADRDRDPELGRPLNRTPATGRRSECVAPLIGSLMGSLRDCSSDPPRLRATCTDFSHFR